ncbi:MAG: radical SAM protein [Anaerolineales bacterium]|nr:radical SAM protein [Anaerolineales bacterium]
MIDLLETLCVQITLKCNLACTHCRAASSPKTSVDIDLPLVKKFLYAIKAIGLKHVSISGGEPGIDKRIGEFSNWLISEGFYLTITTNGTTQLLSRLKSSNVHPSTRLRINVSIDGAKDIHNNIRGNANFEKIIVEASKIKSWLNWIGVNTVVTPTVKNSLPELVPYIKSLGAERWALITPMPRGRFKGDGSSPSEILQMTVDAKAMIQDLGFNGKVVIYNFIGTPHTSILVDVNGLIRVTGLSDKDDIVIGELKNFSLDKFSKSVEQYKKAKEQKCFNWKSWENDQIPTMPSLKFQSAED